MKIHAITTGYVKITQNWVAGKGQGLGRLLNTWFDANRTEWLPIWCFVIEHPAGLIVIDTGIAEDANRPVWFPPHLRLLQRAVEFKISREEEIGNQMRKMGLNPDTVRYVILTHLHQDHDGGLHHFPNAEFIVARAEWEAAQGLSGRMMGYQTYRYPRWLNPTLIDFTDPGVGAFPRSCRLLNDLTLVPTPGHSTGHLSVILRGGERNLVFGGDVAYTEASLMNLVLDGVSNDLRTAEQSMRQMRDYVQAHHSVFLPSHDPDVVRRLS